jgi:HSP20 family protein
MEDAMGTLKPLTLFDPAFDVPSVFKGLLPPMWMEAERMAPTIKLDVEEAADRYLVKADMPGVAKDDIRVDVDGNMVTISAEVRREKKDEKEGKVLRSERYYGTMSRSFTLPVDVEFAKVEAKYAEGVLRLTLPKAKGSAAHRIEVH